jgi:predicted transcriptional regulator
LTRPIKAKAARENMEGNDASEKVNLNQVMEIVSSYVRQNTIAAEELPRLIADVYRTLAGVRQPMPMREPLRPAVPIRRSVAPESVVCLECGYQARTLRRHLREAHGLSPDEYRARWGLSLDHPLIAPGYSMRRSAIAKAGGFGRRRNR